MRRVLHVITTIDRGGAENHLFSLVTGQVQRGWDVHVAYLKGTGYWKQQLELSGINVHPMSWRGYGDLGVIRRVAALINSVQPSIVHAHLPASEVICRIALWLGSVAARFVISKHSDDPLLKSPVFWLGGFWAERGADTVIAISDAVRGYVRKQHLIRADKVTTVRYGLDPRPFRDVGTDDVKSLRAEWNADIGDIVIGTVCRLVPQKRVDILINAFSRVAERVPGVRLVVVGTGPSDTDLQRLALRTPFGHQVTWAGQRTDIPAVMNAIDVFVLCSEYEGFGLVLLESMAASLPIVASSVSAIPEIVVDGRTGILCRRGSVDDFAAALIKCADPDLRESMGSSGLLHLVGEFSVDRMVDETIAIYEKSLKGISSEAK